MPDDINVRRSVQAAKMIVNAQNKLLVELEIIIASNHPARFAGGPDGTILFEIQEVIMPTPSEVIVKGYNLTTAEFMELSSENLNGPSVEKALICRNIDKDKVSFTVFSEEERLEWYRNKFRKIYGLSVK